MTKHSPMRAAVPLLPGLELFSRGKVRDTYVLPNGNLFSVATDGISIFDFVLNGLIPGKGVILNAMNHFWLKYLESFGIKHHLVAAGKDIDMFLPKALRGDPDLQSRAIVIRMLTMVPVEFIARALLVGSGERSYQQYSHICGHKLPSGLQSGDALPCVIDTPTNKALVGHDENLVASEVREKYHKQTYLLLYIFHHASHYAKGRGIKLVDTKLEFGECGTLADEVLTPDSSRWAEFRVWEEGRKVARGRKAPPSLDKQYVREWGAAQGINELDPKNPDHVEKVHSILFPDKLGRETNQLYRYIFWRLTGQQIEVYLRDHMNVPVSRKEKNIAVVCGSKSDLTVIEEVLDRTPYKMWEKVVFHIMSCHRNPEEIREYAKTGCGGADVVICVGGKAFALPGVLDAQLHAFGFDIPVVGVVLGEPNSEELQAAKISIKQLPGAHVIMDDIYDEVYTGLEGFLGAVNRVQYGELPPPKTRVQKPVQMNVFKKDY
ncbi:MAG: hypothetical protein A3D44_03970 [Candidatus Staskawiczbacteria bacterium RIFCSPHIGHO2_02_FULL_42_22]|uniref:phosphoribosylaminoimidazolesuccinocarboxamide synthase n=1 Tax=Candidatus Staskawiczbacteria bacterium RIFCSPHIGHO2_02_FULL_42_22 TaxID=1802207 RepID=A0A1G2I1E6_9BACT|nr:MAG: hypothetical protein A3D44_03970 [Candidatus Staskawiczbacteria bacterium RIFCSPHIGHO2_02_FULL_42_22]